MMRFKDEKHRYAFYWFRGEIAQKLVEKLKFNNLPKNVKIIDGHKQCKINNMTPMVLSDSKTIHPAHLDIVGLNTKTNNAEFICEVKSTLILDKMKFKIHGVCGHFMEVAKENNIPIFLAIVRLYKEAEEKIISYNKEIREYAGNRKVIEWQINYYLNHPEFFKIELYNQDEFYMKDGYFVIKGVH